MANASGRRVVGLGVMQGDETCYFCQNDAVLYVSDDSMESGELMVPSCKECAPTGMIGEVVK